LIFDTCSNNLCEYGGQVRGLEDGEDEDLTVAYSESYKTLGIYTDEANLSFNHTKF
jgi:hypothetical protein